MHSITKKEEATMKKMLAVLTAALLLSATMALAAVPATPVFNTPVKAGEGYLSYELNKRMAFDGTTVYASFAGTGGVRVVKSTNGGTTWGLSRQLHVDPATLPDSSSLRLAVSNDPLLTGKKIIHAAWHANDPTVGWPGGNIIYYSYLSSRPGQTGWSTPIRIDIGESDTTGGGGGTSLAVTSTGVIHILYNDRYITAASPDAPFSYPVSLPEASDGQTFMVMDSSNNLYVAYVIGPCQYLRLTKKPASSSTWTPPVTIYTSAAGNFSRNFDLVVLNPTTYYVGVYFSGQGEAALLSTTNGGSTWTKKSVFTNGVDGDNMVNIAVSSTKVISFASEIYDATGNSTVKVWRSNDNGATWSKPAIVAGQKYPNIALDSAGKLNIMVQDEFPGYYDGSNSNLLWIKEK
jgi:hypothetical protein